MTELYITHFDVCSMYDLSNFGIKCIYLIIKSVCLGNSLISLCGEQKHMNPSMHSLFKNDLMNDTNTLN